VFELRGVPPQEAGIPVGAASGFELGGVANRATFHVGLADSEERLGPAAVWNDRFSWRRVPREP